MQDTDYDFVVVGGGVYGLTIGYYLSKKKAKVAILEQFNIGHGLGSSHGEARGYRTMYSFEMFSQMAKIARDEYWPELQATLNQKFLFPSPFLYFGEDEQDHANYSQALKHSQQVTYTTIETLQQQFPSLPHISTKFPPIADFGAGNIASRLFIQRLLEYLQAQPNVSVLENSKVKNIDTSSEAKVRVNTENHQYSCRKVVLACGKWVSSMVPEIKEVTKVSRQLVGFIQMKNMERFQFQNFPGFFYRREKDMLFVGPDRNGKGVRIGEVIFGLNQTDEEKKFNLIKRAQEIFGEQYEKLSSFEQCFYVFAKMGYFIVDWTDNSKKILICSCCSGHGFKQAPVISRIISDLLFEEQTIQIYDKNKEKFTVAFHKTLS